LTFVDWLAVHGPSYGNGLAQTALIAVWASLGAIVLGTALMLLRLAGGRWGATAVDAYVQLLRNIPVLLPIYLIYFGTADPRAYEIPYRKVFLFFDFRTQEPAQLPRPGDYLAVSRTLLQGLYLQERFEGDRPLELVRRLAPFDRAGDSILLYRLPP